MARRLPFVYTLRLLFRFLPLDGMLRLLECATWTLAGAVRFRDWTLQERGRPQFFKHRINLGRWALEPSQWSFAARGVFARESLTRDCKVLDLCCGDGSYSYLFFSDIAGHIDAVDNDADAIAYARKYSAAPVISYHKMDVTLKSFPSTDYDVIVWNAAICYFREDEIRHILRSIANTGKRSMSLVGMLPKANAWPDHKVEFGDVGEVRRLLEEFFEDVVVKELDEGACVQFYFKASVPSKVYGGHGDAL